MSDLKGTRRGLKRVRWDEPQNIAKFLALARRRTSVKEMAAAFGCSRQSIYLQIDSYLETFAFTSRRNIT